ncbi:MAG: hypothetical protein ACM3SY_17615 [Candidatus Omnitrophota bacterium]
MLVFYVRIWYLIYVMFKIWAILGLLCGAAILAGLLWFALLILAKFIFEDIIGDTIHKIKQKRKEKKEKDHYIYY